MRCTPIRYRPMSDRVPRAIYKQGEGGGLKGLSRSEEV
jgi:hypothetical protein